MGVSAGLASYLRASSTLYILFVIAIAWFVWGLPEFFYHENKRRKRYLRKNYPLVFQNILALRQKGETILWDVPVLHIEGKTCFLVSYFVKSSWFAIKPKVKLTGWIVFNEFGDIIQDTSLFGKAFITTAYADIGGVETQKRQIGEFGELRFATSKYLLRAEKLLKKRQHFFKSEGLNYQWSQIIQKFSVFYDAVEDAKAFYEVNSRFLEAIGHSFGLEFWYKDAVHMEKVRRAFGKYMRDTYEDDIKTALIQLKEIWDRLPKKNSSTRYMLDLFGKTLKQILDLIYYALDSGIPTTLEWQAYLNRLMVAKEENINIIDNSEEVDNKYPFKNSLFHDEIN